MQSELDIQEEVSNWNSLIKSAECRYIDSTVKDDVKLRVDCLSENSLRFRYYNLGGSDPTCTAEDTFAQSKSFTVKEGSCSQVTNGAYYRLIVVPNTIPTMSA